MSRRLHTTNHPEKNAEVSRKAFRKELNHTIPGLGSNLYRKDRGYFNKLYTDWREDHTSV